MEQANRWVSVWGNAVSVAENRPERYAKNITIRYPIHVPFGGNADFSGMSDVPMRIDEVFQKVRIQVDEAGTKAAAATMIAIQAMAMLSAQETVEMRVDRPFVFVIAGGEQGSVCFAGVIENPME